MKRCYRWLVILAVMLFLCACSVSEKPSTYSMVKNNTTFTVDMKNQTISDGTYIYRYELSGTSAGYQLSITYPNGSTYHWQTRASGMITSGYGGWSDDYNETVYVAGDVLRDVLEVQVPEEKEPKNVIVIFFLIIIGLFNLAAPETAWYLEYGWRYKDAEPSETAIAFNRIGGGIALVVAVVMIIG